MIADNAAAASAALTSISSPPLTSTAWLALTLSTSTHLILVAPPAHPFSSIPTFSVNCTAIFLKHFPLQVNWVLNDTLLSVTTPQLSQLCSPDELAAGVCGVKTLSIRHKCAATPLTLPPALLSTLAQAPAMDAQGGLDALLAGLPTLPPYSLPLSCPPACGLGAARLQTAMATLDPALSAPPVLTAPPSDTAAAAAQVGGGGGLFFITACMGDYTDPATGACGNASNPDSYKCALGSGDNCAPCPRGALCPGGTVQWPRPGYQLTASGTVAACAFPSLERCSSFDPDNARLVCGAGYKQGTEGCSGCAVAYFEAPSGTCMSCPSTDITTSLILPLVYLVLGFLGFYAVLAVISLRVARQHGGTLASTLGQCVALLVWIWQALQLIVTAARAASKASPPWLRGLFSALLTLQFEGVTANPSCFEYIPFLMQWIIFGFFFMCLGLVALYLLTQLCSPIQSPSAHQQLESAPMRRLHGYAAQALTGMCLLYATTINASTQVTLCIPTQTTLRTYLSLKQSGVQLTTAPSLQPWWRLLDASAATLLARFSIGEAPLGALPPALQDASTDILAASLSYKVLATNPFLVCDEGVHVAISAVGFAAFVCLVCFPIFSFFIVRLALQQRMGDAGLVGQPTAQQWRDGLHRHWLPLATLLASCRALLRGAQGREGHKGARRYIPTPLLGDSSAAAATEEQTRAEQQQAWEARAKEAAALLDATPKAHCSGAAPMLHPWTVDDRQPSSFYFKQVDQLILFVLTIPTAYNAGRTVGASALPYPRALALQVSLLVAVLGLMAASARMTMLAGSYREHDLWKRNAVLAVQALTALTGALNFVSWMGEEGGAANTAGTLLAFSALLFMGTLILLAYLLRSFFRALEASCKAEAEQARAEAAAAQERRGAAAAAAAAAATGRGLGDSFFSVENPLRRSHKGRGSSRGSGAGQWLGSSAGGGSSRSLDSQGRPMPLGRHRPLLSDKGGF